MVGQRRVEDQPLLGLVDGVEHGVLEREHAHLRMAQLLAPRRAVRDLVALSTIADAKTRSELGVSASRALTDGFDLAFGVGAVLCVVGAAVAAFLLRTQPTVAIAPDAAQAEPVEREQVAA